MKDVAGDEEMIYLKGKGGDKEVLNDSSLMLMRDTENRSVSHV